jgi:hypothetical protein
MLQPARRWWGRAMSESGHFRPIRPFFPTGRRPLHPESRPEAGTESLGTAFENLARRKKKQTTSEVVLVATTHEWSCADRALQEIAGKSRRLCVLFASPLTH